MIKAFAIMEPGAGGTRGGRGRVGRGVAGGGWDAGGRGGAGRGGVELGKGDVRGVSSGIVRRLAGMAGFSWYGADGGADEEERSPVGDNTYSATATDADGDTGSGDTITVSPDGNPWSDTGMSWSGPDVSADYWATPAVSDYS